MSCEDMFLSHFTCNACLMLLTGPPGGVLFCTTQMKTNDWCCLQQNLHPQQQNFYFDEQAVKSFRLWQSRPQENPIRRTVQRSDIRDIRFRYRILFRCRCTSSSRGCRRRRRRNMKSACHPFRRCRCGTPTCHCDTTTDRGDFEKSFCRRRSYCCCCCPGHQGSPQRCCLRPRQSLGPGWKDTACCDEAPFGTVAAVTDF